MNIFENTIYSGLEERARAYSEYEIGDLEDILKDIRKASLYGDIESYEEIRLMDILNLGEADDIDDNYVEKHDRTTGGIVFEEDEQEEHDMSYLDDYEPEEEKIESGFLGFLN